MSAPDRLHEPKFAGKGWPLAQAVLLPGALLVAVWALAIRKLSLEWTVNAEYQYGWVVPILTLLLWWRAWPRRPSPGRRLTSGTLPYLVVLLAALALPLRIIEEANPEWRLLNYYFMGQAILITALLVDYSGGRPWLRHFAFPLLFPIISVPWPSGPEQAVIEGLQRCIASIGVEGASWMGWGAVQRGNLIVLSHGIVGVSEACSGIRSLQSSFMISLFLGEYFRLTLLRRGILVALALVVAFGLNAARAFFLIVMMDLHGAQALLNFHDPAGFGIALACLLLLWIASNFLEGRQTPVPAQPRATPLRFPAVWLLTLLAAWAAAEVLNQGWYLWHEQNTVPAPVWTLHWPPPRPEFKDVEIDEVTRSYLGYDQGVHGKWQDQYQWEVFYFTWNPGRIAAGLAQAHHPDICLPAAGYILKEDLGPEDMPANGLVLPMNRYVFQDPNDGHLLYVFQAVTDDRVWKNGDNGYGKHFKQINRLRAAWAGRRNPGQRSILIVNQGADNLQQAETGVRSLLKDAVVLTSSPGPAPPDHP